MKIMQCIRCGSTHKMERHHIKQRRDGGSNDTQNLEDRCRACHDYEHAKRYLIEHLEYECSRGDKRRIEVYEHRLAVLEALNTPDFIRERGFKSYWTDWTTHFLPRQNLTKEEAHLENQISMWVEEGQTMFNTGKGIDDRN